MYEEIDEQLRMTLKTPFQSSVFVYLPICSILSTLHASQLYTDTSAKAAMPVLFPGNTEFKSQIALTSLRLPKDKTVTKDVFRMGTGVKYCLINKNDPAEFTSSILGVKEDDVDSAALQTKSTVGRAKFERVRFCMCQRA